MIREAIENRLKEAKAQEQKHLHALEQHRASANACAGAVQVCQALLAELDAAEKPATPAEGENPTGS